MVQRSKRSRIRQALGLSVSVFALTLVSWGIYINQTEAAAPFPEGQAEASACAYNRNTLRYVDGNQTPHRPDANTDWTHCGTPQEGTGQIRRIWLPDRAESVEIFQVYGSEGEVVVKDYTTGREYFRQATSGLTTLNKTVMTKAQYPNLGSIVLSIEFEGPSIPTTPGLPYASTDPFPSIGLGTTILPSQTTPAVPTSAIGGAARIHFNIKKTPIVTATPPPAPPPPAPPPPTPSVQTFSISTTPICANNQAMVRIESNQNISGANSYRLITNGSNGPLHSAPEFVQLLTSGSTSSYQIEALNGSQRVGLSNSSSATGRNDCSAPPPPAQVTSLTLSVAIQCIAGNQSNTFIWSPSSATANVILFRDGTQVSTSSVGSLSVTDSKPIQGQTHSYYVQSTTNTGLSSNTMQVATDQCQPTASNITPGNFTLSLSNSSCQESSARIELSWTASNNANQYSVQRRVGSNNFSTIANNLTTTNYTDNSVNSNAQYEYRVVARSSTTEATTANSNNLTVNTEDCDSENLPNLEIEVTPNEGIAPVTITATRISQHIQGQLCTWNFGDGFTLASTANSATHVYSTPGNYLITLACDQQSAEAPVVILADAEVILSLEKDVFTPGERVNFSLINNGPSDIELPNPAPFTIKQGDTQIFSPVVNQTTENLNADERKSLYWTQANNDEQQVSIGNYVVEARYFLNNEPMKVSAAFRIADSNTQLQVASFTVDPTEGEAPLKITGNYSGPELADNEIVWDFGDGNTGFGQTAMHTYTEPGIYTIKLSAGNYSGAQEILVRGPIGTPSTTENIDAPIRTLASTGGSLFVALLVAFGVSALLSYFIVRRPFTKDEDN